MTSRLHSRLVRSIAALFMLGAASCTGATDDESGADSVAFAGPNTNLLLVTLDTTRADRIGVYGHAQAVTPRIDELAARGIRFERAYAHAPVTLPTHASLLTGTLPPEHGIRDNGRKALGTELTTLAEIFSEHGFRTGAFVSAIALDGSFGLDRGFDVYDDDLNSGASMVGRVLDRPASAVVDSALAWLGSGEGPFFLWTHFYDAHADYAPPADFRMADPYDGEIAYVDAQLGRLLGWLESRQMLRETLIVVVADHGESLGEKGEHTHASLIYDGTQRIPWLMVLPERIPAGAVSNQLVQQSDLLPTLMEMYDWSLPEQVSGNSFAPLLRGERVAETSVYLESEYAALNFGWSPLRGLIRGDWKYIQAPTPELYNLARDPAETSNLAASEVERVREFDAELQSWLARMRSFESTSAELGPGMAEGLSHLGYVQGGSQLSADGESSRINPIERIEYLELYHQAVGFANHGEWTRMIEPLEQVVAACPEGAGFRAMLGDAYRRLEEWDKAREQLEAAIELDAAYDPAHFYLGAYHEVLGETAEALSAYRRTLELRPEYVPAREAVARLSAERGDLAGALDEYALITKLDPNQARHWVSRSGLERSAGLVQECRRSLDRALELGRDDLAIVDYCAWLLATSSQDALRDGARSASLAQSSVTATNRSIPRLLDTLAAAQAENDQFEAAIATAEEALDLARAQEDAVLVEQVLAHLVLFRAGQPVRED